MTSKPMLKHILAGDSQVWDCLVGSSFSSDRKYLLRDSYGDHFLLEHDNSQSPHIQNKLEFFRV